MTFRKILLSQLFILFFYNANSQSEDSVIIKKIYDESLNHGRAYSWLDYLSNKIGGRLSGSLQAAKAVEWARQTMKETKADSVFLQECMVPHWIRGEKEVAKIINGNAKTEIAMCALGGSIATDPHGLTGKVVEVKSFDELKELGKKNLEGKIVFFNRPMDPSKINTFEAYGGAVDQRWGGAMKAAPFGAIAVVVRSMTTQIDDFPHTGSMGYNDTIPKIPACAISTSASERLSAMLRDNPNLELFLKINCQTLPDEKSFNVVGEIKGSEHPEEFIIVGGHLDSWELGDGAHDDGAGVVQSLEVLRILKQLGIRTRRTIRAVAFMNEENGLRGGKKYAELAKVNNEKHIAAIESDAGGFSPRGFFMEGDSVKLNKIRSWKNLFVPYNIHAWDREGGGADIGPLKEQGTVQIGLSPDSQRYFDYHHTAKDKFDAVNYRELQLGAASMTALIYLIDKYGL